MSKKTFIHAENNHNILSSNEVRLYNPPKPEELKVVIWGKELCNIAEWNDFLKCVEEKTRENDQLKQQLVEKDTHIEELERQFAYECECNKQLVELQKQLAEKDKEIERLKQELEETNAGYDFTYEQSTETIKELKQNQTQLAIKELEKVNGILTDTIIEATQNEMDLNKLCYLEEISARFYEKMQEQIKELKGQHND